MLGIAVLRLVINLFKECCALAGLNHLEYGDAKRGFHSPYANQEFALQEINKGCKI
jgi:hypothetical protein